MWIEKLLLLIYMYFFVFVVYFITVIVPPMRPLSLEIPEWSVKREVERMKKDVVVAQFPALYLY
jgi:hypothetical protein